MLTFCVDLGLRCCFQAPEIRVPEPAHECARYDTVTVAVDIVAAPANPYDPDQIAVDAVVTAPSGAERRVPAFWWEGFERSLVGAKEQLRPTGESGWRVRYTPTETGTHSFRVELSGAVGAAEWTGGVIRVREADDRGFVRVSAANPRYFAFDDASPYFALGHNVCWPNDAVTYDYADYFASMEAAGENYARLWMGPGWSPFSLQHAGEGGGLARFDQGRAWRLDYVLDLAERRGLYVMLCLESFNYLRATDPYPSYDTNPYRAEVGGPISSPAEFFTDEEAKRWFRNRLRYLVARYGHSTHLLAWEFWNEVDLCEGFDPPVAAAWHGEMARYLRDTDPYDHLITTSFAHTPGYGVVDGVSGLDFVQSHSYGAPDMMGTMSYYAERKHAAFGKPHVFGEFGVGAFAEWLTEDPDGIHLHEGIWASTMSGDCGCAAIWWWDGYVRPRNLYYHYAALARFLEGAPFDRPGFGPLDLPEPDVGPARFERPRTVEVLGAAPFDTGEPKDIRFAHDARMPRGADFPRYLHGTRNHPEWHNPVTFRVSSPTPWRFAAVVDGVSGHGGAGLRVSLDGEPRIAEDFADRDDADTETMRGYNGSYTVEVPAGAHVIVVENPGNDWIEWRAAFEEYALSPESPLRVLGIGDATCAYLWIRHARAGWRDLVADHEEPDEVAGASLVLSKLAPGRYTIEHFDTWTGEVTATLHGTADPGGLVAPLPAVTRDAAVRVRAAPGA